MSKADGLLGRTRPQLGEDFFNSLTATSNWGLSSPTRCSCNVHDGHVGTRCRAGLAMWPSWRRRRFSSPPVRDGSRAGAVRNGRRGRVRSAAVLGGGVGWLMAKQASYYREFTGLIRAAKADGSAALRIARLSFTYAFSTRRSRARKAVIASTSSPTRNLASRCRALVCVRVAAGSGGGRDRRYCGRPARRTAKMMAMRCA